MAVLYHPSLDPSRVYYGTDTRALELLRRRGTGDGLAQPPADRQGDAAGAADDRRRRARRPGRDRADVLALERVLALPLPRRLRALRWARRSRSPPSPTPPRGSGRSSVAGRCAGSANAHTASTSGPCRSSSSPRRRRVHGPDLLRAIAAGGGDHGGRRALLALRREPDPPRRPGQALDAVESGALAARAEFRARAGSGSASPGSSSIAALAGLAGVGVSNSPAIGGRTVAQDDHRQERQAQAAGDAMRRRGAHRRLDLGGPGLRRIFAAQAS